MRRVVITGLGAITPLGNTVDEYWESLLKGKSGANPITKFNPEKHKTRFACEVKGFSPELFFEKGEARKYDLFTQYALVAVEQAINQSGIFLSSVNRDRIGVIWASGNGGVTTFDEQMLEFAKGDGTPRFNPFFIPRILVNMASGIIAMKHQLRGINYTAVSACASANTAMMDAFNYIRWGKADAIITGGSEAPITPSAIGGFNACKALSTRNDDYTTASRPFDKLRDGFVMGEGAGALIFEDYEHAIKRGANIIAEIVGAGMSADAYHLTATHPDGLGAILAMSNALEDAGLNITDIDYVNLHATSTPIGDISEMKALQALFKEHLPKMNLSATKSQIGHLLGAAGAVEGIATVLALKNRVVTPTINTTELDAQIPANINLTLGKPQERKLNYALSNNFGFGGHNATIIFKRFV